MSKNQPSPIAPLSATDRAWFFIRGIVQTHIRYGLNGALGENRVIHDEWPNDLKGKITLQRGDVTFRFDLAYDPETRLLTWGGGDHTVRYEWRAEEAPSYDGGVLFFGTGSAPCQTTLTIAPVIVQQIKSVFIA